MVAGMLTFSLISISLGIMSVSYGDVMPIDNTNFIEHLFHSIGGSISGGLDKLQSFSVGIVDLSTIFHQLIFWFFSFCPLQLFKLKNEALAMDFKHAKINKKLDHWTIVILLLSLCLGFNYLISN